MPNLNLTEPFETLYLGLLPSDDDRICIITRQSPAVAALANNFHEAFRRPIAPTFLVLSSAAPDPVKHSASLASFRNLCAVACVADSWTSFLYQSKSGNTNVFFPLYSDFFDLYPHGPLNDGKELIHKGLALESLERAEDFSGQCRADLPNIDFSLHRISNKKLLYFLLGEWHNRFVVQRKTHANGRLFRSLAVAYNASSVPNKNSHWLEYDMGISISLWVSAFEVLVHPGPSGRADLQSVLDVLAHVQLGSQRLKNRVFHLRRGGRTQKVNGLQKLYCELYSARNDFLHGNNVTLNRLFFRKNRKGELLTHVAPLDFKMAIVSLIGEHSVLGDFMIEESLEEGLRQSRSSR